MGFGRLGEVITVPRSRREKKLQAFGWGWVMGDRAPLTDRVLRPHHPRPGLLITATMGLGQHP